MHGKSGMAGFDDDAKHGFQGGIRSNRDHFRARNHDAAGGQLSDLDRSFDHRQGVMREQAVGLGQAQFLDQFLAAADFAGKRMGKAFKPGTLGGTTGRVLAHCPQIHAHWGRNGGV